MSTSNKTKSSISDCQSLKKICHWSYLFRILLSFTRRSQRKITFGLRRNTYLLFVQVIFSETVGSCTNTYTVGFWIFGFFNFHVLFFSWVISCCTLSISSIPHILNYFPTDIRSCWEIVSENCFPELATRFPTEVSRNNNRCAIVQVFDQRRGFFGRAANTLSSVHGGPRRILGQKANAKRRVRRYLIIAKRR